MCFLFTVVAYVVGTAYRSGLVMQRIPFDRFITSINGNNFNTATSTFTCHTSGTYLFVLWTGKGHLNTHHFQAEIQQNGVRRGRLIPRNWSGNLQAAGTLCILHCYSGDVIDAKITVIVNYNIPTDLDAESYITGVLLHQDPFPGTNVSLYYRMLNYFLCFAD